MNVFIQGESLGNGFEGLTAFEVAINKCNRFGVFGNDDEDIDQFGFPEVLRILGDEIVHFCIRYGDTFGHKFVLAEVNDDVILDLIKGESLLGLGDDKVFAFCVSEFDFSIYFGIGWVHIFFFGELN